MQIEALGKLLENAPWGSGKIENDKTILKQPPAPSSNRVAVRRSHEFFGITGSNDFRRRFRLLA